MKFLQEQTAVIVIDYQERIVPAMESTKSLMQNSERFLEGLRILEIPMVVTQQYTSGLGMTVPSLQEKLHKPFDYYDKVTFSVYQTEEISKRIKELGRKQLLLCGIEAHVCVLMSALDLKAAGYDVMVVTDCIRSRKTKDYEFALERFKQEGILLTTSEAVLFELLGSAKHPSFKEISKLVK